MNRRDWTDNLYKFIAIAFTTLFITLQYGIFRLAGFNTECIYYLQQEQRRHVLEQQSADLTRSIWALENELFWKSKFAARALQLLPAVDKTPAQAGERFRAQMKAQNAEAIGLRLRELKEQRARLDATVASIPQQPRSDERFLMEAVQNSFSRTGDLWRLQAVSIGFAAIALLLGYLKWYRNFQIPNNRLLAQQAGTGKSNPKSIRAGRVYKR